MRIQVLFGETSVLVPCGDGKLTVRELVDKAIVRFKKVLNKHADDIIEANNVRLAESGSFVAFDDEVADILEDKEVVEVEYKFLNDDDDDDTSHSLPRDTPIASVQVFTPHLNDSDHAPYTSDLHEPFILPNIGEGYSSSALPSGRSSSQELHHHLEDLDDGMVGGVPSLHGMGMSRASQDLDMINQQLWQSQNSGSLSLDPSSPHLGRKQDWPTGVDTGYATNKSQESGFSQSQPKSQEFHHGGSVSQTMPTEPLSYASTADRVGGGDAGGEAGVGPDSMSYHSARKLSGDRASSSGHNSSSTSMSSSLGRDHRNNLSSMRKDDPGMHGPKGSHKTTPTPGFDHPHSFSPQSHDGFSPSPMQHPPHSMQGSLPGAMDHMGRMYDPMGGWGYKGYMPSLEEGSAYDRSRMMDHFKRRSMSSHGPDNYPRGLYGTPPQGGSGMGRPPYSDVYGDHRGGQGMFGHPHDPHYGHGVPNSRLPHSFSHERMNMSEGMARLRPPFMSRPGMEEEFSNSQGVAMEMYLSQPTNGNYFSYDRLSSPGYGHPMMGGASGPPYGGGDPRFAMGNPHGVSLSQPGVMLSHHRPGGPGGFGGVDRHMLHPQNSMGGMSDRMSDRMRANSIKSLDSLDRRDVPALSIDEEMDLDIEDEDNTSSHLKLQARNPFQRDFRKSIFRDGSLYSQWMDRMYEYDLQDPEDINSDIPTFEGDSASQAALDNAAAANTSAVSQSQSNEESGLGVESGEESGEEDDEYGNIHIVELHKKDEPLGIQLTHFTSAKGIDLGVYIAGMVEGQFAAKSGSLQLMDRILACNGCDFTKRMSSEQVEEVFGKMVHEPLLRMAISRGGLKSTLQKSTELGGADREDVGGASVSGIEGGGVTAAGGGGGGDETGEVVGGAEVLTVGVAKVELSEKVETNESVSRPSIRTVAPSAAPTQAASLTLTNTRQIGVKHKIELKRSINKGYGFGLTSRDVQTDKKGQPVYVKIIHHNGPAYQDGRLQLGDRVLEVDGVDVVELGRPEVVQLLREAAERVEVVVSRQEVVEEQGDENETPTTAGQTQDSPLTVNKTVLTLSIPLHNSGPAGLGVSVYTRSTGNKNGEEMGVYIKSIVPGGAAAMDGRLRKNDQVLSVNNHSLVGHSNHEAMDILKASMTSKDTVTLMVARKAALPSPSMAALGEEPEEEEHEAESSGGNEVGNEVGIDVPLPGPVAAMTSNSSVSTHHRSPSATIRHGRSTNGTSSSVVGGDSAQVSLRARSATVSSTSSPTRSRSGRSESPLLRTSLCRSQDLLGSGDELYDRLDPLPAPAAPPDHAQVHTHSLLLDQEVSFFVPSKSRDSFSNLDDMNMTSLDFRGMSRTSSITSTTTTGHTHHPPQPQQSHPPQMSRDLMASGELSGLVSRRMPASASGNNSTGLVMGGVSSTSSLLSDVGGNHSQQWSYPARYYPDSASLSSSVADGDQPVDRADAPVRGSGRRDRNRPERGSGRGHTSGGSTLSSISPEPAMVNGFATMPHLSSPSYHGDAGGRTLVHSASVTLETISHGSHGSLENLRLSDSESNMAFRRDNPGRISITKKTKKVPLRDLAHLHYIDSMPLIEGEKPSLVRAGSDGFLNEHVEPESDFMENMAVGPSLGLVKSSSLESLHNVMHHHIIRDIVDDGVAGGTRRGPHRNSFKRTAMDHSYGEANGEEEQRGVDVDFGSEGIGSSAMISFTKSPHNSKIKKKGFFQKVFKKRKTTKKSKTSPESARAAKSMEVSPASLSAEERDKLMKHYTLQLRPHANTLPHPPSPHRARSGTASGTLSPTPSASGAEATRSDPGRFNSLPNRFSMPALDDYDNDSPGSPDEQILATVAKV